MKTTHIFLLATLTFFLFGCIPSLNPLYTNDDLVTDDNLIGEWCENQSKETWTIEKRDGHL